MAPLHLCTAHPGTQTLVGVLLASASGASSEVAASDARVTPDGGEAVATRTAGVRGIAQAKPQRQNDVRCDEGGN